MPVIFNMLPTREASAKSIDSRQLCLNLRFQLNIAPGPWLSLDPQSVVCERLGPGRWRVPQPPIPEVSGPGQAQRRCGAPGPWHSALQRGKSTGRERRQSNPVFPHRGRAVEAQRGARWAGDESVWLSAEAPRRRRAWKLRPQGPRGPHGGSRADRPSSKSCSPRPSSKAGSLWPGCSRTAGRQPLVIWPLGQSGAE